MASVEPKRTRAEEVYLDVRGDLLAARYRPGQWLRLPALQKEHGVSLSVVREALTRLVAEGLLEAVALRGFRVIELSTDDLRDLTSARISVEVLVLRESLLHGDAAWEAQLVAAHHLLVMTPMLLPETGTLNRDFVPVHAAFHHALLAGCPNNTLLKIANELRDRSELYRMWAPVKNVSERVIAQEHEDLTKLAIAREADAAAELLARHIDHTRRSLERSPGCC
jgi:DNA-binding GntR family transcriptional regulator